MGLILFALCLYGAVLAFAWVALWRRPPSRVVEVRVKPRELADSVSASQPYSRYVWVPPEQRPS